MEPLAASHVPRACRLRFTCACSISACLDANRWLARQGGQPTRKAARIAVECCQGSKWSRCAYQAPTMDAATTLRLSQLAESFRLGWSSTPLQYDLPSVAKVNSEVARWHEEYRARGSTWFSHGDRMAMCCGSYIGELVRRVAGREELA